MKTTYIITRANLLKMLLRASEINKRFNVQIKENKLMV